MALPNSNISVSMVKSAIGSGSNDVGTLCTHPNINKWSKWKPVIYPSVHPISIAALTNAHFGLEVHEFTPADTNDPEAHKFIYSRPTGGVTSPYRLGDFRNYDHEAVPSYFPTALPSIKNKAIIPYSVFWGIAKNNNPGNALLGDVKMVWNGTPPQGAANVKFRDLMVGVQIRNSVGEVVDTQFSEESIEDSIGIEIDVTNINVGHYTCHLFTYMDGFPDRRFPFPSYEDFPNHQSLQVIFEYPFNLQTLNAYRYIGATDYPINIQGVTNNVTNAGSTTSTRLDVRINATGNYILDLKKLYLMHFDNMLFNATTINDTFGTTVINSKAGTVIDGNLIASLKDGDWIDLQLRTNVTIKPNWDLYPSPYSVYYYVQYEGQEILGAGSIWRNV
ncbi:MAG TPA: hypothetical protein GX708_00010 [Gallicola sp.]|nr:hypothetical protein [Gallicola sp.]